MEKEDVQRSKIIETTAFVIGGGLLLIGVIIALIILINYKCRSNELLLSWFNKADGLDELATALVGTTGLLWSLGGTIFFIYTIIQTRTEIKLQVDEMRQTNESLKTQQLANTFFNLLENHKKLVSTIKIGKDDGNDAIHNFNTTIRRELKNYRTALIERRFSQSSITNSNPVRILRLHESIILSYINSVTSLILFIKNHLNDSILYYEILDNFLSVEEKYLIGIYVTNCKVDSIVIFKTDQYNFLRLYEDSKSVYTIAKENYFPEIKIQRINKRTTFYSSALDEESIDYFNFNFTTIHDEYHLDLALTGYNVKWRHKDFEMINEEMIFSNIDQEGLTISLDNELKKILSSVNPIGFYGTVDIIFKIMYNNDLFYFGYYIDFKIEEEEHLVHSSTDDEPTDVEMVNYIQYSIQSETN
jgi:hypothetical protein